MSKEIEIELSKELVNVVRDRRKLVLVYHGDVKYDEFSDFIEQFPKEISSTSTIPKQKVIDAINNNLSKNLKTRYHIELSIVGDYLRSRYTGLHSRTGASAYGLWHMARNYRRLHPYVVETHKYKKILDTLYDKSETPIGKYGERSILQKTESQIYKGTKLYDELEVLALLVQASGQSIIPLVYSLAIPVLNELGLLGKRIQLANDIQILKSLFGLISSKLPTITISHFGEDILFVNGTLRFIYNLGNGFWKPEIEFSDIKYSKDGYVYFPIRKVKTTTSIKLVEVIFTTGNDGLPRLKVVYSGSAGITNGTINLPRTFSKTNFTATIKMGYLL